jgi:hypothetical protein
VAANFCSIVVSTPLDLTTDQITAAELCGVSFLPATSAQVQRYSMQRKIFRLDGQFVLATRDGSFFETAATLERWIAEGERQQRDLARGRRPPPHQWWSQLRKRR